jgi:hypothetical protein
LPGNILLLYRWGYDVKAKGEDVLNFCDLMCKYAEAPKETAVDGAGSCRTFVALYYSRKKSLDVSISNRL